MKNKILIYGRLLVALAVLILSGAAFFVRFYPVKIFDAQFTAALQSGSVFDVTLGLVAVLAIIVITLIFGRMYCSTLCPLGLYQELLTVLFKPFYKKRKSTGQPMKHYVFAYFIAALLFGTLLGGTAVLIRMLDPYSIAGNAMSGAWFGLGFVAGLTILVFFEKRFFCTNICPVGAVLGLISRFSLFKIRIDNDKCKICSLCARSCPCGSIDFKNHTVNNETCVKCFKCLAHCNHGALYYGLPKEKQQPFSPKRRQLIVGALCATTLYVAHQAGLMIRFLAAKTGVIIPSGAGKTEEFANRCLNCNLCVKSCPMKIIKPATADVPFVHLDYGDAFCDYNCHKCSEVCPSGAIKRITLETKQHIKIANAVINEDICIKCGICAMECPKKIIIKEDGDFPLIQFDKCIGCGKCAGACPVKAIKIEPISQQVETL
ncbi:MAG: 4Fe-4S binding protein, partial [Alphaproteobacteria bacterium]|nr:4Fe-4S binding protein [Alphaproteobacteria bacterium]